MSESNVRKKIMEIKRTIGSVHKINTYTHSSTTHAFQWDLCQTEW